MARQSVPPALEQWIKEIDINGVPYSEYWNNEAAEESKPWHVAGDDYRKMEDHIRSSCLLEQLDACRRYLELKRGRALKGVGLDLAAGNLWAAPHLLAGPEVEKLYCLEYSRHRLLKLGPPLLQHYQVDTSRIVLVVGSFYELKIADHSVDFIFMSQGFHHADEPKKLLTEMKRALKPDGCVILIGEHVITVGELYAKHFAKSFLSRLPEGIQKRAFGRVFARPKSLFLSAQDLIPEDLEMGDHFYYDRVYDEMFRLAGFESKRFAFKNKTQAFVLTSGNNR